MKKFLEVIGAVVFSFRRWKKSCNGLNETPEQPLT